MGSVLWLLFDQVIIGRACERFSGFQCRGEAGRSLFLDRVSDFMKNLIMFLVMCFLVSLFFSSSSNVRMGFPKVYCLSFVKAAQSSRMCMAVSFSSASLQ